MIVVKETDAMTELTEAAKAYRETKDAHKHAADVAREAVLAALQAGNSVPEVTKAGPFTYAYVRGIAEANDIPRDERKARYQKAKEQDAPPPPPSPPSSVPFMAAGSRTANLIEKARRLPAGRYVELASWLEQYHWDWLRTNRTRNDSDWDVVKKAIGAGLLTDSQLV